MGKLDKMVRFLPGLYQPSVNTNIRGLLSAWAEEDDKISQAITDAKEQLFVLTAQIQYLDSLGSNVGVFRPTAFNLADELYRRLIPALSYHPKQVRETMTEVLDIFFGENNPEVIFAEINPNEIVIQIPSAVPALRRTIKGSHHFKVYSGYITYIDDIAKEMTIDLEDDSKVLQESELAGSFIGQGLENAKIADNTAGTNGVTLQFGAGEDLSVFNIVDKFVFINIANYPGSFFKDKNRKFNVRALRGILGQNINKDDIIPTLTMQDASQLPNSVGYISFNTYRANEENLVKYIARPNNTTILLDPAYKFKFDHFIGEPINLLQYPKILPDIDGTDYGIYTVGVTAARILAQRIIESIAAAGVVVRWIVKEPVC